MSTMPGQRSFDDLGTPLSEVTFVVIDLETTGSAPEQDAITEVGAVRCRAGERLATLGTLVDPGRSIPGRVTMLTGITEALVAPAPRIEAVLPTLVELCSGAVLVGHNVRFDLSFLRVALRRAGWPSPEHPVIDTLSLARRLLADEVPDHRLGTLAARLRLAHRPSHRALADAEATCDLLHVLIERAARAGVTGLDDLLALPTMAGHPQAVKLGLTARLPRQPGVYVFRGRRGEALYVGTAADLRTRVRSYFSTDRRRAVPHLLRETSSIDHQVLTGPFAREVAELRLIQRLAPRHNREWRRRSEHWMRLTLPEPYPRLMAARRPSEDGALHLGPFARRSQVEAVIDAVHGASRLRRCRLRPRGRPLLDTPCAPAQIGVALCPCAPGLAPGRYAAEVRTVERGLTERPSLLLDPLVDRMGHLSARRRFEEAAVLRDRALALSRAVEGERRVRALRALGEVSVSIGGGTAHIAGGRLIGSVDHTGAPSALPEPVEGNSASADEARLLVRLLDRLAPGARAAWVDGPWGSPWPRSWPAGRLALGDRDRP